MVNLTIILFSIVNVINPTFNEFDVSDVSYSFLELQDSTRNVIRLSLVYVEEIETTSVCD